MHNYSDYDAMGLSELVSNGEVSASELLEAALTRAKQAQTELNCFSALFSDVGRHQTADGLPESPLSGVPFATKNLAVEIAGQPLTNGSRLFEGHVATRNSTLVERYRRAGLVLFGQTTSPEYGLTTSTEGAVFGQTRNPWDTRRTSGGSSGGASAAVASGVLPLAQASDGGGSIRIPAACTGLFGMKPSRGRIPMGPGRTEGWFGLSTVHAVSRSVRDSAALMDVTHGREVGARYLSSPAENSFLSAVSTPPRPLRVGLWVNAPNGTRPDTQAHKGLYDTVRLLQDLGHWVEDSDPRLDGTALGKAMLMTISADTALVVEDRLRQLGRDLQDDDLEPVTRSMVELGRKIPMSELARANQTFQEAAIRYESWMIEGRYDVCLMPTLSREPVWLGMLSLSPEDTEAYNKAITSFAPHAGVFNQIGCPAMSVPLHWSDNNLPIGMMFGARYGEEALLYSLAGQLEQAKPWFDKTPPIFFS